MLVAKYRLDCDGIGCGVVEPLGEFDNKSQLTSEIMKRGWVAHKGNRYLCPKCVKKKTALRS